MLSIAFRAPIPRVAGTLNGKPNGVLRVSKAPGLRSSIVIFAALGQRLSSLLVRGVVISFSARQGASSRIPRITSGRDSPMWS